MGAYATLVNEYRGELLDLVHFGYVCIVDENSNVIYHAGDENTMVFYRSASKPHQALPVIMRGLDKKYSLTDEETVIFAGSHTGDTFHVDALESIHRKAGLNEELLIMNPAVPQVKHPDDIKPRKFYHNCSGKHTAALLLQRELGGEKRDYWKEDSPAQREIKRVIGVMSEFDDDRIITGLDGCGVPVFAVPMKNIAIASKNLARPDKIRDDEVAAAAAAFAPRIHRYPLMMRGKNLLCSLINYDEKLVGKGGANAVYGLGIKDKGIGISIKIQDGCEYLWPMIIHDILKFLGHDCDDTYKMLESLCPAQLVNDNGTPCGRRETAFIGDFC